MHDWTKIIKATTVQDPATGAVNTPIQLSSTFNQASFDEFGKFDYSRSGNPTREVAEHAVATLEDGQFGYLFSTGMAAISSVLMTFSQGDHLIISKYVYGGTFRILEEVLPRFGIEHTFVDLSDLDAVAAAIQPNTKAIYIETPSNPILAVTDIAAVADLAHQHHLIAIADNTFMSPVLQKPLHLGVDIVVHSATKFLAGHSDIVAGAAITNDQELADQIYFIQNAVGATLGVTDCWLLLRGIKTLGVRMQQSSSAAQRIAEWLEQQPQVTRVCYPGLPSNAGYAIQQRQAVNGGAVLSFDVGSETAARTVAETTTIPEFSVSLGGTETILSYPPKMSHAELSVADQAASGITPGLLRFSVGLEDPDDLIADLAQAFAKIAVPAQS
ncbi:cystathionine beta-lyase [Lacticaseibacillus pantheris DSM 15945 = JCM 12539 = NBRC 106106]|uniref:cysteine-S-conjugate beta-lyase n=1 Tax=Lacticaseibacillus pantheris DSM 15945 = JCM 12539 = NBRC 106106 TaxID=1423783 RepID=A0A0R1U4J3_9LACO|nr:aminotransferase class I/II-fold pyridoxal phosphate-dependent enzyme [Lacticaseibacillus pantheris]KRL88159.1 cystathionine beta-lyase [Lacticaseibacillus pantheris DSM 15945 = JCM 12539 = NBRC 106106]